MKERLVGAAVLVALGIVLIPLLLDGPEPEQSRRVGLDLPAQEDGARRHRIEITRDADQPAGPGRARDPSPPEESGSTPAGEPAQKDAAPASDRPGATRPITRTESPPATAARPAAREEGKPAAPEPVASPPDRQSAPEPAPKPAPKPTPVAEPSPSSPAPAARNTPKTPPAQGGWAVQIGSFGSRDNANRLQKQLEGQGFSVFQMPIVSGGRTLHRVRVGPYAERGAADAAARRLAAGGTAGKVVEQED